MSNKKVWIIPLEPFPGRYTEQWYRSIPKEFSKENFDVEVIDGVALTDEIDVGSFLPMNSTVHYKSTQMAKISELFQNKIIKDTDIFWIADLEFWGIEAIRLMSQMNNISVKIYAFLHAASYTKEDAFEVAAPYQQFTEVGWIAICDKVFVGSNYHKNAVIERRLKPLNAEYLADKIVVTGNPIFIEEYPNFNVEKKNQIILPNRFDYEKRPNLSLDFAYILKKKHPDWNIVLTTGNKKLKSNKQWLIDYAKELEKDGIIEIKENCSKNEYHLLMAESKVMLSNSIEENFGYCIVEAMIYNTYPLCSNSLSHPELVNNDMRLLYNDTSEIIDKIEFLMGATFLVNKNVQKYEYSIGKMVDNMIENQIVDEI